MHHDPARDRASTAHVPDPGMARPAAAGMGRRAFLGRSAGLGAVAWAAPSVLSTTPVAAATGSCAGGISVCEFTTGLEGWTIDNSWGSGINGLWNHNTEASRDGGSLHYGRGTSGNYETGTSRNSGRVRSPEFDMPTPSSGFNSVTFTVWREVETQDPGYDRFRLRILGSPNRTLYSVSSIGNTSGFETHTITIPSSYDGDTVRFQFDFDTRDGLYNDHEGIYVGRFQVTACPVVAGSGFSVSGATANDFAPQAEADDDDELSSDPPRRG